MRSAHALAKPRKEVEKQKREPASLAAPWKGEKGIEGRSVSDTESTGETAE